MPPEVSVSVNESPSVDGGDGDVGVGVDGVEHVVDRAGEAEVDDGRVAAAVGDADLAALARRRRR